MWSIRNQIRLKGRKSAIETLHETFALRQFDMEIYFLSPRNIHHNNIHENFADEQTQTHTARENSKKLDIRKMLRAIKRQWTNRIERSSRCPMPKAFVRVCNVCAWKHAKFTNRFHIYVYSRVLSPFNANSFLFFFISVCAKPQRISHKPLTVDRNWPL